MYDTLKSMTAIAELLVGKVNTVRIQIAVGDIILRECDLSEAVNVLMEHEIILLRQRISG